MSQMFRGVTIERVMFPLYEKSVLIKHIPAFNQTCIHPLLGS